MTQYKLRKSDLTNLRESDTWLTNGHWMVKKCLIDTPYRLDSEPLDESKAEAVKPKAATLHLTRTNRIINTNHLDPKYDIVIFESPDGAEAGFDRRYIQMLNLTELYGTDANSAFADDPDSKQVSIVIMPKRL